jgi:hypothetical protein
MSHLNITGPDLASVITWHAKLTDLLDLPDLD